MEKQEININITDEWRTELSSILQSDTFGKIMQQVKVEYQNHKCCPPRGTLFRAFNLVKPDDVRVVILGQDPYHTPNVANGLAFSVAAGSKLPPSLVNIIKEIKSCYANCSVENGDLEHWARQGVLLLNTCLTVREGQALSHNNIGWENFTSEVIKTLGKRGNIAFILWGGNAKKYLPLIETRNNLILTSAHPSPLSAHNGFFGCAHFKRVNDWLAQNNKPMIKW